MSFAANKLMMRRLQADAKGSAPWPFFG